MPSAVAEKCRMFMNRIVAVDSRLDSINALVQWIARYPDVAREQINHDLPSLPARWIAEIYFDPQAKGYVEEEEEPDGIRREIRETLNAMIFDIENGEAEALPEMDFGDDADADDWNPFARR